MNVELNFSTQSGSYPLLALKKLGLALTNSNLNVHFALLATFWACLVLGGRIACADTTTLPAVVVSATHLESTTADVSSSVTVVTRQQITDLRPTSVADALRLVPGLHLDQPGGRAGISSVYLRGADPNFTLIKLDGVVLNDLNNSRGGSFDLSTIDVDFVEKIEVVRGAVSSVHGSGALGGIINIVTASASREPSAVGAMTRGTRGERNFAARIGRQLGPIGIALHGTTTDSGDIRSGGRFRGENISAKLQADFGPDTFADLSVRVASRRSTNYPDDSGGPMLAVRRELDRRESLETAVSLEMTHSPNSSTDIVGSATYYNRRQDTMSPGVAPGLRDPFGIPANSFADRLERSTGSIRVSTSPSPELRATWGFDARHERGVSKSTLNLGGVALPGQFSFRRLNVAVFGEAEYQLSRGWKLLGGVRADSPEGSSIELSTRLGGVYLFPSQRSRIRFNWSEGFKLPSFFALGNPVVGNASLKPESGDSFDIAFTHTLPNNGLSFTGSLFLNRFKNLIDLAEGPPPSLVNRSDVVNRGFEVLITAELGASLTSSANVTYLDSDVRGTAEELRNRPRWRGSLQLTYNPLSNIRSTLSALFVGKRLDSSIPTGNRELDRYIRLDWVGSWKQSRKVEWGAAIENLLDTNYEDAIGVPSPGITARIFATLTF